AVSGAIPVTFGVGRAVAFSSAVPVTFGGRLRLRLRDAVVCRDAVEQVKIGHRAELVSRGIGERLRRLVLGRAGGDAGVRGQCLIGGEIASGEGGGAGLLA